MEAEDGLESHRVGGGGIGVRGCRPHRFVGPGGHWKVLTCTQSNACYVIILCDVNALITAKHLFQLQLIFILALSSAQH